MPAALSTVTRGEHFPKVLSRQVIDNKSLEKKKCQWKLPLDNKTVSLPCHQNGFVSTDYFSVCSHSKLDITVVKN